MHGKPWYRVSWDDLLGPWGCAILAVAFAALTAWFLVQWGPSPPALGPALLCLAWGVAAIVQHRKRRLPRPAT